MFRDERVIQGTSFVFFIQFSIIKTQIVSIASSFGSFIESMLVWHSIESLNISLLTLP